MVELICGLHLALINYVFRWVVLSVFAGLLLIRLALGRICNICGDGVSSLNICRVACE